jgi:hypothetical protein
VNTNIGHRHQKVVAAVQEQAGELCTVAPQHVNRGTATLTTDPDKVLPNELSRKYSGLPYVEFNPASVNDGPRVIVRVTPHKVAGRL